MQPLDRLARATPLLALLVLAGCAAPRVPSGSSASGSSVSSQASQPATVPAHPPVAPASSPSAPPVSDVSRPPYGPFATPPLMPPLVPPVDPYSLNGEATKEFERGGASWYGPRFHGRRTASGEVYDMNEMTAAHRTLPFGTSVRVRSLVTGQEVDVRVTDRGPFGGGGRVIDLSRAAAKAIGLLDLGVKDVVLYVPESVEAEPTPQATRRLVRAPARKAVRKPVRRR